MTDGVTKLMRLPGTYPAQDDTWLLANVLRRTTLARGRRVLDVCTGTGALAVVAADVGAASIDAVDLSWRSVLSARANSGLRRSGVALHRGDLFAPVARRRFDDARGEEALVVVGTAPAVAELVSPAPATALDRAPLRRAS